MVRITIDEKLKQEILAAEDANEIVELRDVAGRLIAYSLSARQQRELWKLVMPELTEEEVSRRVETGEPGFSSHEVKQYIQKRAS